jgi:hypothetical protein
MPKQRHDLTTTCLIVVAPNEISKMNHATKYGNQYPERSYSESELEQDATAPSIACRLVKKRQGTADESNKHTDYGYLETSPGVLDLVRVHVALG